MRVQKLALAVGLVSALGGNGALALGLGEIKLNSTLNQPLDAEIKLLQTRGLEDSEIKVRIASAEDFERAGLDRAYLFTELKFDVDTSSGTPVVRISSRSPIREPFLNFLVETRWPSGRLLREYTLLMDLPAFSTNTAAQPVRAAERERQQVRRDTPVSRPVEPTVQRAPEPVQPVQVPAETSTPEFTEAEPEPTPAQPEPVAQSPEEIFNEPETELATDSGSRVYGPVEANKTLWEIARDSRETREVSVQQTMLAIQRLNPEAFINDNINLLKRGAVLRLPSTEEVRALTRSQAVAEVASQNEAWRERVADTGLGAPLDGRAVAEDSAEVDALEGRVSLAAPGDNESVLSGSGSGAGESEALAGELAVTEEELDKSRLESAELQERIGELDEQIETMERLVEVSNEEMRAVQDAAAQTNDATESLSESEAGASALDGAESAEESPFDESSADDAVAADAEQVTADTVAEQPVDEQAAVAEEDSRNQVAVVQTQPEPTLMDRLMDNILFVGIGAGALLAGLFGFVSWRRRREEEEAIRQVEAEMAAERAAAEAGDVQEDLDQLSAIEELEADDNFELDQLGDMETGDPIAEAEIHLSLGQYQEAETKLLSGLKSAPENTDARLMLLEVYAKQQDVSSFDDHYRQLLGYSDGPVADRAARLRETIAGAGPFEAPSMQPASGAIEGLDELDELDADIEDSFSADTSFDELEEFSVGAGSGAESDTEALDALDDLSLDLDSELDAGLDQAGAPDTSGTAASGDDDFSLDLDLDGDFNLDGLDSAQQDDTASADDSASGDFDLGELDLDSSFDSGVDSAASESAPAGSESAADELEGLDFDLDLSPMDDDAGELGREADKRDEAEQDDELDMVGNDAAGLDLDTIDLGDLDFGEDLTASGTGADESDLAVAEKPSVATQSAAAESADFEDLGFDLEGDLDSELNLLEGSDEVSTKLELAQAYLDMGDKDGAREILGEVVEDTSGEQQQRAKDMLERMT